MKVAALKEVLWTKERSHINFFPHQLPHEAFGHYSINTKFGRREKKPPIHCVFSIFRVCRQAIRARSVLLLAQRARKWTSFDLFRRTCEVSSFQQRRMKQTSGCGLTGLKARRSQLQSLACWTGPTVHQLHSLPALLPCATLDAQANQQARAQTS